MSAKALAAVLRQIETDIDVVCTCSGEHRALCPKRMAREAVRVHESTLVAPFTPWNLVNNPVLQAAVATALFERPGLGSRMEGSLGSLDAGDREAYYADAARALAVVEAFQERAYLEAQRTS